jgi:hypothetical protein
MMFPVALIIYPLMARGDTCLTRSTLPPGGYVFLRLDEVFDVE